MEVATMSIAQKFQDLFGRKRYEEGELLRLLTSFSPGQKHWIKKSLRLIGLEFEQH